MASVPLARTGLRWGIYERISGKQGVKTGDEDDDTVSLETQESGCRELIKQLDPTGTVIESLVVREIWTGTELFTRPELTHLRDAIRRHEIDAIACYQPKRWARDPDHAGYLKTELREHGVMLRFVLNDYGDGDVGDVMGYLEHWTGKKEHKDITERTHRARAKLVHLGEPWVGCKAPYGLRWTFTTVQHPNGRIEQKRTGREPDPVEAAVVAWMFARFLELGDAASLRRLAAELAERRIVSPAGKAGWTHATIKQVLQDRLYIGEAYGLTHRQDRTDAYVGRSGKSRGRHKYRTKLVADEEQVRLPDRYAPRIVDDATFAAVQAKLAGQSRGGRPPVDAEVCIMRGGRARCAHCGRALVIQPRPTGAVQLKCNGRQKWNACAEPATIAGHLLDTAAIRLARAIYERPEIIAEQAEVHRASDPTAADLAMVEGRLAEISQQQANLALVAAQLTSAAAAAPLVVQLERLAAQQQQAEDDRAELLARRAGWEAEQSFFAQFEQAAGGIGPELDGFTAAEWQRAIDALGIRAIVRKSAKNETDRFVLETRFDGVLTLAMVGRLGLAEEAGWMKLVDTSGSSEHHQHSLILSWPAAQVATLGHPGQPLRPALEDQRPGRLPGLLAVGG